MKTQHPKQLKPGTDVFHKFMDGKTSDQGKKSATWKVVYSLFKTAQRLYSTLDSLTSERLSVFVDSKTYLTSLQEHDLVALTAHYVANLDTIAAREIVNNDTTITNEERQLLLSAIDLFLATASALGNPHWFGD